MSQSSLAEVLTKQSILVVDDEASVRKSISEVLADEGFLVYCAKNGNEALSLIRRRRMALVLLDIWMPGTDGIETLKKIRTAYPKLPVVMISGHATIGTAVRATQLGANDFIEKPLELNSMLKTVRKALGLIENIDDEKKTSQKQSSDQSFLGVLFDVSQINSVAFREIDFKGKPIRQKTLAQSAILYGQGLHSGKKSGLMFQPLPVNSGIHFVGMTESTIVPAHIDYVASTGFATTVQSESFQVGTIEHIMATLHAYGISNLLVKCNGEVPVMDGSAVEFCSLLEDTGIEEQDGEIYAIKIPYTIRVGNEKEFIQIEPSEDFIIDYYLDYPAPVGSQHYQFQLGNPGDFKKSIAPARTFGFVKDISYLQAQGLALGGRFDNFVLFGDEGAINGSLRFDDEPARHKILDAMGDLFLLGRPLQGHVTAKMTGHSDNISLVRAIKDEMRRSADSK